MSRSVLWSLLLLNLFGAGCKEERASEPLVVGPPRDLDAAMERNGDAGSDAGSDPLDSFPEQQIMLRTSYRHERGVVGLFHPLKPHSQLRFPVAEDLMIYLERTGRAVYQREGKLYRMVPDGPGGGDQDPTLNDEVLDMSKVADCDPYPQSAAGTDDLVFTCSQAPRYRKLDGSEFPGVPEGWDLLRIGYDGELLLYNNEGQGKCGLLTKSGTLIEVPIEAYATSLSVPRAFPRREGGFWILGWGGVKVVDRMTLTSEGVLTSETYVVPEELGKPLINGASPCAMESTGDAVCLVGAQYGFQVFNVALRLKLSGEAEVVYPPCPDISVNGWDCFGRYEDHLLNSFVQND